MSEFKWPKDRVVLPTPSADELSALALKYRRLAALRERVGQDTAASARQALRELSAAFPGALREIDVLALRTLEARAAALEAHVAKLVAHGALAGHRAEGPGGAKEPSLAALEAELPRWAVAIQGYHRLMALCLWLKPALRRSPGDDPQPLIEQGALQFGVWLGPAWLKAIQAPPKGRLNTVVFALLEAALALPPGSARELVFPMEASCSAEAPPRKPRELTLTTHQRIADIGRSTWEALRGAAPPPLSYDWLEALEDTGCVSHEAGWLPLHLALRDAASGAPLLLAPAYVKAHSQGEFVFDQSWAAFCEQRLHAPYYPKLIIAVPFTPATGPRLLTAPGASLEELLPMFVTGVTSLCERLRLSSAHILFPSSEQATLLASPPLGLVERHGVQFHFTNPGYSSFEDFLGRFSSKRRNQIRRERRALAEQGLELQVCSGAELDAERVDEAFELYLTTVRKFYWGRQYLNRSFFEQVFERMPLALQVVRAVPRGTPHGRGRAVALAINLVGEDALYGRYWGAFREVKHLHFNVCYYRGVEHCIEAGLRRFEPGAGGEHKLARGFDPALTPSFHFLADPRLRGPVLEHAAREREAIREVLTEPGGSRAFG